MVECVSNPLGRDSRRVHDDVEAPVNAGLLDKDEIGLHADHDSARTETRIAM